MNKIDFFSLHNLHNNEHFQFLTDVDVLIAKLLAAELGLTDVYPNFKVALTAEDKAMRVEQGSSKSKAVEDLNKLRGKTWNACFKKVNSYLLSPFDDEVQSAVILKRIFDLYGDPRKMPLNDASADITNLVNDLQLPANAAHVEKVGLAAWIGELKKQNNNFQTLFNERNAEYSGRESGDVQAVRIVIDPLYQKIVDTVNATVELKLNKPAAASFIGELNQKIKYYRTVLAARDSRNNDKKTPPPKA
jgi:hypothetical protein